MFRLGESTGAAQSCRTGSTFAVSQSSLSTLGLRFSAGFFFSRGVSRWTADPYRRSGQVRPLAASHCQPLRSGTWLHVSPPRLRSVLDVDATEELAAVALPILCLQARADNVVPRSATALIQRLRPDMRLIQLDAPHCVLQVVPQDAARVIAEFVVSTTDAKLEPIRETIPLEFDNPT